MKLTRVVIKGFRSYRDETTIKFGELTTLIGNNGAGKTTALIVLNKMFSANVSERIFHASDFYSAMNEEQDITVSKEMSCDAYFQMDDGDGRAEAVLLKHACLVACI